MKVQLYCALAVFILILTINNGVCAFTLKLTKILCHVHDKTFATFEKCLVKAESRTLQYVVLYIKFLKLPITDIKVRFTFLKRGNGYKPFLYDFIFKCDFLKYMNPIKTLVWDWFKDTSNLNHSCPLVEDFEIKRIENRYVHGKLQALPLPPGEYCFVTNFSAYGEYKFDIQFFAKISD